MYQVTILLGIGFSHERVILYCLVQLCLMKNYEYRYMCFSLGQVLSLFLIVTATISSCSRGIIAAYYTSNPHGPVVSALVEEVLH